MRRLTVVILLVLAVTVSAEEFLVDFWYVDDSKNVNFGLGIGETGYLTILFYGDVWIPIGDGDEQMEYSGKNDYVLTFTVSGPTGFKFKLDGAPGPEVYSTSSRIHVGTTADTVSAVATEIIVSQTRIPSSTRR